MTRVPTENSRNPGLTCRSTYLSFCVGKRSLEGACGPRAAQATSWEVQPPPFTREASGCQARQGVRERVTESACLRSEKRAPTAKSNVNRCSGSWATKGVGPPVVPSPVPPPLTDARRPQPGLLTAVPRLRHVWRLVSETSRRFGSGSRVGY